MKYLKEFENHAAYEAAKSSLILPNVSLCLNENEVHYNPLSPTPSHIEGEFYYRMKTEYYDGSPCLVDWNGKFLWAAIDGYPNAACVLPYEPNDGNIWISWVNERDSNFTDLPVGTIDEDSETELDGMTYENHTFYVDEDDDYKVKCTPNVLGEW